MATPSARESERRYATVLFADVSGFTAMSRKRDPEELTALMNECFHLLEEEVTSHGGHVDKYIGDCLMALLGVPHALEDAPRQAINASIEMRNRIGRLVQQKRLADELGIHIGINSGLVVAGDVGGATKREFTVMGDTVNLASRLKDAAPIGQIWVGTETWNETRLVFEYEKLPPRKVKGMDEPIQAYAVRSTKSRLHRDQVHTSGPLPSLLVGREQELATLRGLVGSLGAGTGAVVTIGGEAGIGKSRLLEELATSSRMSAVRLLKARSIAIGENLAFHPFSDLLRAWAAIDDEDDDPTVIRKLDAAVGAVLPGSAGEMVPFLGRLMGLQLTGAYP